MRRHYSLFILTLIYTLAFIDRQILVILQEAIKRDLNLSDTQLGLLTGFSFAVIYTLAGIPIASLADKSNRRNIIAVSLTVWSAMTALSGMAVNYWQLLAARVGVGLGEAGCTPPSHSMISNMYSPEKRATALSIYSTGMYVGIFMGLLIGGYVQKIYGWRITLLIVGLPGLFIALLLSLTVREPKREKNKAVAVKEPHGSPFVVIRSLWQIRPFRYVCYGGAFAAFGAYGNGNFFPGFLERSYAVPADKAGVILAMIVGFGGFIGTFSGGWLADRFGRRGFCWYAWIPAIGMGLSTPLFFMIYHVKSLVFVSWFLVVPIIMSTVYLGPSVAFAHHLAGLQHRAMASGLYFFVINLIGLGCGPVFVGWLSDIFSPYFGDLALQNAMKICSLVGFLSAYFLYRAGKTVK